MGRERCSGPEGDSVKRIVIIVALIAVGFLLSACNTTKGVGTDIENAGDSLKRSAERNGAE